MGTSDNPIIPVKCHLCWKWVGTIVNRGGVFWCLECNHKKEEKDKKQREIAYAMSILEKHGYNTDSIQLKE